MQHDSKGPMVKWPPTLVFCGGLLGGWGLHQALPFPLDPSGPSLLQLLGLAVFAAGAAIFFWGLVTFGSERTGIMFQEPARRLVTRGPYRFSRNPMYVGFAVGYCGIALLANTAWPFFLLPPVMALVVVSVIGREEQYLRSIFGEPYDEYCRHVRRWL
jgi:protein-S-isoprenylcysteine O-methyltransferase Ste14